jgi:hypothetical protein
MAISATIALSVAQVAVSSVPREQKVRATVTVSNSGGSDVSLSEIVPSIKHTSQAFADQMTSAALGTCRIDKDVPAGGSEVYVFDLVVHAPVLSGTYDISCLIYGNSQVVKPTPATLTVTAS